MSDLQINDIKPESLMDSASGHNRKIIIWVIVLLLVVVLAVTSALLVKYYVVTTFVVQGVSMYPTLDGGSGKVNDDDTKNGEILYLNKLAKIRRGDIVVLTPDWDDLANGRSIVKRVIGVGGDTVEIRNGVTYLNGQPLDEPYAVPCETGPEGVWEIPEGSIFCMGDNRPNSLDCRSHGPVSLKTVVGRCFLIKGLNGKLRKP